MAAGDWIKMTKGLPDKPEFRRIRRMLGLRDPDILIGRLFRFWSWMDAHAVPDEGNESDGLVPNLTVDDVDEECGRGFSAAMTAVGWMAQRDGGIVLPGYFSHNGTTGKLRAENTKRQTARRASVTKVSRKSRDKSVTNARPEERREEEIESASADSSADPASQGRVDGGPPEGKPRRGGRPNPIWDALVAEFGLHPQVHATRLGKLARDLRVLGASPEDIGVRIRRYRAKWPDRDCTPEALVKHWGLFASEATEGIGTWATEPGIKPRRITSSEADLLLGLAGGDAA